MKKKNEKITKLGKNSILINHTILLQEKELKQRLDSNKQICACLDNGGRGKEHIVSFFKKK